MITNQQQIEQEEAAEVELWIAHQMEQEEQDKHDLRLLHEHQEHEKTIREKDEEECCPGHEYEYIEQLESNEDYVRELWNCLICNKTRVFTKRIGVRD
jgi:hypothetical protein